MSDKYVRHLRLSIAEELCTLVITEAYPEDSGIFQCTASNHYGSVSCSAMLEVYTGKRVMMYVCIDLIKSASYT